MWYLEHKVKELLIHSWTNHAPIFCTDLPQSCQLILNTGHIAVESEKETTLFCLFSKQVSSAPGKIQIKLANRSQGVACFFVSADIRVRHNQRRDKEVSFHIYVKNIRLMLSGFPFCFFGGFKSQLEQTWVAQSLSGWSIMSSRLLAPIKFSMLLLRSTQMLCKKQNHGSMSGNWQCEMSVLLLS